MLQRPHQALLKPHSALGEKHLEASTGQKPGNQVRGSQNQVAGNQPDHPSTFCGCYSALRALMSSGKQRTLSSR